MPRTLYICYFGLREPLVQTQVLPYLREIRKDGIEVSLLTFEPELEKSWTAAEIKTERQRLAQESIEWYALPYHKRPSVPATLFDVLNGTRYVLSLSRKKRINVLHARAHIPLLMAKLAQLFTGSKVVFDVRGLIADEYVDAGIWQPNSLPYRIVKRLEVFGLRTSDAVVILTEKLKGFIGNQNLRPGKITEVIPCCVDFSRVNLLNEKQKAARFELIYAGSVVGLYLLEEMGRFFLALRKHRPNAFFRVLTTSSPERVTSTFGRLGISPADYEVQTVAASEVISILERSHAAISFRRPTFSQIGASPTKIAEYLAAGLPVVMNAGIGDMDKVIEDTRTGVILEELDNESYDRAAEELIDLASNECLSERCRKAAHEYFDLEAIGGVRYRNLYKSILENKPRSAMPNNSGI